MKALVASLVVLATLVSAPVAMAKSSSKIAVQPAVKTTTVHTATATQPSYCGNTPYDLSYRAVYEYPTGSYWQAQIAAYPDYYAANNAYYQETYGC